MSEEHESGGEVGASGKVAAQPIRRVKRADGTVVATKEERGGEVAQCAERECRLASTGKLRLLVSGGHHVLRSSEVWLCDSHRASAVAILGGPIDWVAVGRQTVCLSGKERDGVHDVAEADADDRRPQDRL